MLDPTTLQEVAKQSAETARGLGQLTISANLIWTLICGFMVMFMQAGFAMLETGLTRSKNVANTMAMNFLVYSIGVVGFWAIGFGLQMGGVGPLTTFGGETTLSHEFVATVGDKVWGLFGSSGFFLPLSQYTFVENTLKVDDPVGAVAVHCANGVWGILALGLFANGTYGEGLNGVAGPVKGLFYGDSGQFFASLIGIGTNVVAVGSMAALTFTIIGRLIGNRVSREVEVAGLDVPEMGVDGYIGDPGVALPDEAPSHSPNFYSAQIAGGQ